MLMNVDNIFFVKKSIDNCILSLDGLVQHIKRMQNGAKLYLDPFHALERTRIRHRMGPFKKIKLGQRWQRYEN